MKKIELINDSLWLVEKAIEKPIEIINQLSHQEPFTECEFGSEINKKYRDSTEIKCVWNNPYLKTIWGMIQSAVPNRYQGRSLIGPHYSTFYLLKYNPGQKFKVHRDGFSEDSNHNRSFITVLIYLSSGVKGGETKFYAEPDKNIVFTKKVNIKSPYVNIKNIAGNVVLMRHYLLHEALPVLSGTKYILRFNILYSTVSGNWNTTFIEKPITPGQGILIDLSTIGKKHFQFLKMNDNNKNVKYSYPGTGEDYCDNCYAIIPLYTTSGPWTSSSFNSKFNFIAHDYYECPRCYSPVIGYFPFGKK